MEGGGTFVTGDEWSRAGRGLFGLAVALYCILGLGGLHWGLPSAERNALYFRNDQEAVDAAKTATGEYVQHSWDISRQRMAIAKLPRSVFNPVRSFHPDEHNILKTLANMRPAELDLDPRFFDFPTFHVYLVGAALQLAKSAGAITVSRDLSHYFVHPEHMAGLYVVGRLLSFFFGLGCVILCHLIAHRAVGPLGAGLAAVFFAVAPLTTVNAHYLYFDIPQTFWVLLAFWLTLRILHSHQLRWYALAGAAAGLAASTKYYGILISLAVPAAVCFRDARDLGTRSELVRLSLAGLSAVLAFLAGSPYIALAPAQFFSGFMSASNNATLALNNWSFYGRALRESVGPGLLFAGLLALPLAIRRGRPALKLVALVPVIFWGTLGSFSKVNASYVLPAMPFVCILAGGLLGAVVRRSRGLAGTIFMPVATAVIASPSLIASLVCVHIMGNEDVRLAAGRHLAATVPEGRTIGVLVDPWAYSAAVVSHTRHRIEVVRAALHAGEPLACSRFVFCENELMEIGDRLDDLMPKLERAGFELEQLFDPRRKYPLLERFVFTVFPLHAHLTPRIWIFRPRHPTPPGEASLPLPANIRTHSRR